MEGQGMVAELAGVVFGPGVRRVLPRLIRGLALLAVVLVGGCAATDRADHGRPAQSRAAAPARAAGLTVAPAGHTMTMEVCAYCPCKKCCGPNARGVTASGQKVSYHHQTFVAADTKVLPFYTWVVVPGYNQDQPVPVIDRGGGKVGNRIDVFFSTHEQALRWGRRTLEVRVVQGPGK
jgi:3D (Asp-Asp-Asp) domain-containing protein